MIPPSNSSARSATMGVLIVAAAGTILLLTVLLRDWGKISLQPTLTGQIENCLTCHNGIEPISAAHSIEEFGCVSCHGGTRLALDADSAHTDMVSNPAALDTAQQYCGDCHAAQVLTVQRSIMTTYAGAIGLIRRAFGQQADGTAQYAVQAVGHLETFAPTENDPLPVHTFAENCLTCHIDGEGIAADYFYRGTGCASCHVLYADDGLYLGDDPTISRTETGHAQTHEFTTAIPYTQCNHCHNRGNYDLRTMTFVPRDDMPAEATDPVERRVHDYYQPISQFTRCEWELDCIDCHTSHEVMGDGVLYNDRSEAQYTQCQTCHGTLDAPPLESVVSTMNDQAMRLANLNPLVDLDVGDTILVTERGEPLYNIRQIADEWILTGKATGETYVVPLVQGSTCQQDVADQVSSACHQCHTDDRSAPP